MYVSITRCIRQCYIDRRIAILRPIQTMESNLAINGERVRGKIRRIVRKANRMDKKSPFFSAIKISEWFRKAPFLTRALEGELSSEILN